MSEQESKKQFTLQELFDACNKVESSVYRKGVSNQPINLANNQNKLFLIFGITTSGKTVIQYYLCQDQLQFGMQEKKKLPYLIPVKQYLNAAVQKAPNAITTRSPNVRAHKQPQSQNYQQSQIVFVEIPDIKQLKDEQKTCQYFFLQKLFNTYSQIHILIVITELGLDDGASLIQNFQCITSLFDIQNQKNQQILSSNMSIIINKSDPKKDTIDIKEKLQDLNTDIIQQENQALFNIINTIIRDSRVYVIKEEQPQENQQKQMFEEIVENSQCTSFGEIKLNLGQLEEFIPDEETVGEMLEKVEFADKWLTNSLYLFLMTKYLSDTKNRQENLVAIQPLLKEKLHKLKGQLSDNEQTQLQMVQFEGKISLRVKSSLINMLKQLKSTEQQSIFSMNSLKMHFYQVKLASFQQLGIFLQKQFLYQQKHEQSLNQSSIVPQNPSQIILQTNNIPQINKINIFYLMLGQICNDLSIGIQYLTDIVDYKSDKQPQNREKENTQHTFSKQSLVDLAQQLIINFKEQFNQFQISWFRPKSNKKGKKTFKKKQQIKISYTIQNLKQQILTNHKSKPKQELLNYIFTLPNTHFKLYMLCLQLPSQIQPFIDSNFLLFRDIVQEISSVLKVAKLYIEQIKFLALVPDWNRIENVLQMVEKHEKSKLIQGKNKQALDFLNKLGVYAKQSRRVKLSQKIFKIVDEIVEQISARNSLFTQDEFLSSRQALSQQPIQQKSFHIQVLQLYSPSFQGYPVIVQLAKERQQRDWSSIQRTNQFLYMISQERI